DQNDRAAAQPERRPGTQGGDGARLIDPQTKAEGTPGVGSAAGGASVEQPSQFAPRTGLAGRVPADDPRVARGQTIAQLRAYVAGCAFPANKEDVIRAARRNG